jgi:hypothetical protein
MGSAEQGIHASAPGGFGLESSPFVFFGSEEIFIAEKELTKDESRLVKF